MSKSSPKVALEVKPWIVPNFVLIETPPGLRQDGWKPMPGMALKDVDPDVLSQMCDQFRTEVFEKAGKQDPQFLVMSVGENPEDTLRRMAAEQMAETIRGEQCLYEIIDQLGDGPTTHIRCILKARHFGAHSFDYDVRREP